jgi:hypothetical protein
MTSRSHTPEDVEKIQSGWRKRQTGTEKQFDKRIAQINDLVRNEVLEEVAKEFDKMKIFEADTMASLAVYIRNMKK